MFGSLPSIKFVMFIGLNGVLVRSLARSGLIVGGGLFGSRGSVVVVGVLMMLGVILLLFAVLYAASQLPIAHHKMIIFCSLS